MTLILRARVIGEHRDGRPVLAEYQEAAAGNVYDAAIMAVRGFREATIDHAADVAAPTALVVLVEPFDDGA
jgi:hypothetical protein